MDDVGYFHIVLFCNAIDLRSSYLHLPLQACVEEIAVEGSSKLLSDRREKEMSSEPSVAVVIPAFRVSETIGLAIQSALAQPETAQVIVVDDASGDETVHAARAAAPGDERLVIIENSANLGPSRARNIAIDHSDAPFIAVLDGDDILLPGRFSALFSQEGWDFCADNIVFFDRAEEIDLVSGEFSKMAGRRIELTLSSFVEGNLPKRGRQRGELGFLKPVMRRAFLEAQKLRYVEECRLGEDFLLYVEALAKGAKYFVIQDCGYAALVRPNSLSGTHSTADLGSLYRNEAALLERLNLTIEQRAILKQRVRSTLRRLDHRLVLERKIKDGLWSGVITALSRPTAFADIARDWLSVISRTNAAWNLPQPLLDLDCFEKLTN